MKPKVLIVDDSPCIHDLLRAACTDQWDIRCALTGVEGLAMAKQFSPTLIILDLDLPDINGFDVCRHMRAESVHTDLAILFLSSCDSVDEKLLCLEIGGSDFVSKPFFTSELILRGNHLIRTKLLLDELPSAMRWCAPVRSKGRPRGKRKSDTDRSGSPWLGSSHIGRKSSYSKRAA